MCMSEYPTITCPKCGYDQWHRNPNSKAAAQCPRCRRIIRIGNDQAKDEASPDLSIYQRMAESF
jgi:hypothetical protein